MIFDFCRTFHIVKCYSMHFCSCTLGIVRVWWKVSWWTWRLGLHARWEMNSLRPREKWMPFKAEFLVVTCMESWAFYWKPHWKIFFTDGRKELIQVMGWFQLGNKPVYLHVIPYLRVYHVENYVIHHHVVLHGGSRSKIYWHHLLFIP